MGKGKAPIINNENYQSIAMLATYMQYLILIAIAVIAARCIYIIVHMSTSVEENVSMSAIVAKVQNNVKALVIAIVAEAVIALCKKYLF